MIDWARIEQEWSRYKVDAKRRWDKLGEQQLNAIAGRRALLASRIRDTYGLSAAEAEKELTDWQDLLSRHASQQVAP